MLLLSKRTFISLVFIGTWISTMSVNSQPADSIRLRILSYNMDSLGAITPDSRYSALGLVSESVSPDVIVAQGVNDTNGANQVRGIFHHGINGVRAPYIGMNHSVLMFDSTLVKLAYYNVIPTAYLPIDEYILYVPATLDTFIIISCSFVSGNDSMALERRELQAQALRFHLHQRKFQNIVVTGTLNFYSNSESGYRWLTEDSPFGDSLLRNPLRDPVDSQGVWHHNPNFSRLHTYNSQVDTMLDTSGLVDRFDFILLSPDFRVNAYVNSTHKVTGNSGSMFGKSITRNGTIGTALAGNLEKASRHLPVQVDLMFRRQTTDVRRPIILPSIMDLSDVARIPFYRKAGQQPFRTSSSSPTRSISQP